MSRVIVVRQDNNGDVLLTGPALRAVAASGARITMLCGPRGAQAAHMLPEVDEVLVQDAPWIDAEPERVTHASILTTVAHIRDAACDQALIFTSFHQSPLPTALLLRMAGIQRIGAISVDYPGSLLDVRHAVDDKLHEVLRNCSLAEAMGFPPLPHDDRRMRLRTLPQPQVLFGDYVVVHPGATVPARTWTSAGYAATVEVLTARGVRVVVTGDASEAPLTACVAGGWNGALDLGGRTSFAEFCAVVAHARAVICGNTSAVHVASATGTPVVSIFPPTIEPERFRPWQVPYVMLGDHKIECAGCRAKRCPRQGQPCLTAVTPQAIVAAVDRLQSVTAA